MEKLTPDAAAGDGSTARGSALAGALGLNDEQLEGFVADLFPEVADSPGRARFGRTDVHQLAAVQALVELRAPRAVAVEAARCYSGEIAKGGGWLVVSPGHPEWTAVFAHTGPDLLQALRTSGGRSNVLDLDSIATRAGHVWNEALTSEA